MWEADSAARAASTATLAERLRRHLAEAPLEWEGGSLAVTLSLGVTAWTPGGWHPDVAALLREADQAMYRAKRAGRNRVECGVLS